MFFRRFLLIILLFIFQIDGQRENDHDHFFDIGVRLIGDQEDSLIADLIAEERDFVNTGHIRGVDLYHFRVRREQNRRSKRSVDELVEELQRDERIAYFTVGESVERQKRGFIPDSTLSKRSIRNMFDDPTLEMSYNDVFYSKQWYLENKGQLNTPAGHDINVVPAWLAGYSGTGIVVSIIDDGVEHVHLDLIQNYKAEYSYDLNDLDDPDHDPTPNTSVPGNSHGTHCAGAAVGKANNGVCGVGVAHNASLAGIRLLDGKISNLLEARGITLFATETDIKSASWGPMDDGKTMEAPGSIVNAALDYAVTKGRHGKGTILVWASGNGGTAGDDCGADGYASHPNVISISTINHLGKTTYFDEFCPSTMAVTHTGGQHSRIGNEQHLDVGVVAADVDGGCITNFLGTSAAAPIAAGAFALVLEANPDLTYRDMMHIITRTARIPNLAETDGWTINGAGHHVNDKFGFGVLDVGQMIAVAQNWTNVQPRYQCYEEYKGEPVPLEIGETVEVSIEVESCENVTRLEHVVANVSCSFHRRGDVRITLISPRGTPSELISYRDNDATSKGIEYFPFMTVHNWGEDPIGKWTLRIETRQPRNRVSIASAMQFGAGQLTYFGLRLYGSFNLGDETNVGRPKEDSKRAFKPTEDEVKRTFQRELHLRNFPNVMGKRDYEELVKQRRKMQDEQRKRAQENLSLLDKFRRVFRF